MSSQHKTQLIGWHSADPTLKAWIEAEASRRGMSLREFLDEVLADRRATTEAELAPGDRFA